MFIRSNVLTASDVRNALVATIDAGHVGPTVQFARFREFSPRTHSHGIEVILASSSSASWRPDVIKDYGYTETALRKAGRRYYRRGGDSEGNGLQTSPSWHEFGFFIAELYKIDPDAQVGVYNSEEHFRAETEGWDMNRIRYDFMLTHHGRIFNFMDV